MEMHVIRTLDWELNSASPLFFLERYQRILNIDQEHKDATAFEAGTLAREIIRKCLKRIIYLKFSAAEIAAAAILHSMRLLDLPKVDVGLIPRKTIRDARHRRT